MRIKPSTNEIYHVYNRGVEKRKIFLNDKDHLRFIHDLFEFNDQEPALNLNYYFNRQSQSMEVKLPYINPERNKRKFLVELQAFCLMPNHFHLMLKQLVDNGITEFMRKIGTGYTNYFNKKYTRVGSLFQGPYKSTIIKSEAHFIHLPYYIHFNPLDLYMPEWRDKKIKNFNKALKYLKDYRWSSYLDYIGKKNFPSVTQREFLLDFLGGSKEYKKETTKWLREIDLDEIKYLTMEV